MSNTNPSNNPIPNNNPLSFVGTPADRASYRTRFPICGRDEVAALRETIVVLAKKAGCDRRFIDTVWVPAIDTRFLPAVVDCGEWVRAKGEGGSVDLERDLARTQAAFAETVERHGFDVCVPVQEINSEVIPDLFEEFRHKIQERDRRRIGATHGEERWTKLVKAGLSLPQTLMLMMAVHFEPGHSLIAWGGTLAFAFGVSAVNQTLMRPIAESFAFLGENQRHTGEEEVHARPGALWAKLGIFSVAAAAVCVCVAQLDATFIEWASSKDRWGNPNPQAIAHGTALALAGAFSGMLSIASLVFAVREAERATVERQSDLRINRLVESAAAARRELRDAESAYRIEQEREAELFAAADAEWYRLLYALYGMYVGAEPQKIARFLLGTTLPEDPDDGCGATLPTGPKRPRGLLGLLGLSRSSN